MPCRIVIAKRSWCLDQAGGCGPQGEDSRKVRIEAKDKVLSLACESDSSGESVVNVDLDSMDGDATPVFVNYQALESAAARIPGDTIVMQLKDEDSPVVLDCPPVWWTIMPLVKGEDHGKKKAVAKATCKRSRQGHPERVGSQQKIRELMFQVFDLCDATGWWDEVWDALYDEARLKGATQRGRPVRAVDGFNRHDD